MEQYYKEPTPVEYSAAGMNRQHDLRNKKGVRLHWHDRMELIRLHAGKMRVGYGENTAELDPGQIYVVPPKTPHCVELITEQVEYDVLVFDVRRFYNETDTCMASLPGIFDGRVAFHMTTADLDTVSCYDRLYALGEEDSLETVGLVYQLLHLLLQRCVISVSDTPRGDATVRDALEYIRLNFTREITTQQLAARYGYSTAHFCRKFKEATWLTPMNYLRIHRLEEAARQLKQGKDSVSHIALRCGFQDSNYFTRCFKSHFGVPPTRY